MNPSLHSKLYGPGPKRILALDGGGIKGVLTLGILQKVEKLLRQQSGNPKLVLGDHYDLITGTSTGAIIAAGLCLGMTVDEIVGHYLRLGKEIFGEGLRHRYIKRSNKTLRALFSENYSSEGLEKYLREILQEVAIGDQEKIRCGIAINAKRADTYSLWTVANHPDAKYYGANAHLKLWELCRASSAAPYYFKPMVLKPKTRTGKVLETAFIDGGVSLSNNPSWTGFLVATSPAFGFKWQKGVDNILINSLGTGNGRNREDPKDMENMKAIIWASKLADLFMVDAQEMTQVILEVLGNNVGPAFSVDSMFGGPEALNLLRPAECHFSFMRHNVLFTVESLKELGLSYTEEQVASLREMDHHENMQELLKIGQAYADKRVHKVI